MSKDAKCFTRPKVRFCQVDTDKPKTDDLKNKTDEKNTVPSNKPRIRSVVTLEKPIRLLKLNTEFSNQENKDLKPSTNNAQKTKSLTACKNAFPSCTVQTIPLITNSDKVENQKPLSNTNSSQNIEKNDALKTSKKTSNDIAIGPLSPVQNEVLDKVLKSQNIVKTKVSRKDRTKVKEGKENEALPDKRCVKDIVKTTSDPQVLHHKTKPFSVTTNTKKVKAASKSSTLVSSKKINPKSITTNVMPCHKYNKAASKVKTCSVKKTLIRDVIGPEIKPYIGPGVSHKEDDLKVPKTYEGTHIKPCTDGEKLARPEYNSITCTISKLNEMKKQKVVTNIENLPITYKNLINGKISSALDFPLDETIYKNLVDLSIDEKQLPSRLIRSKDPEPRQKDAVPVLSDFFTPISPEEYCTPVSIKPRIPETTDNWSAFRISDKIFEWKYILDHV